MSDRDVHFLRMAARLAIRGRGGVEPNPMVGCVIVSPGPEGKVVGWGYHRRCGGPHAEIIALLRAGTHARGATLYCTLEPCNHTGRTPPCVHAIIRAGIKRVVIARQDPHTVAAGGLQRLRAAGIETSVDESCAEAIAVSDPFVHRVTTGLPWVIAKWAQTLDGKIATRPPACQSKWISNPASRTLVHRERGRVDAILTGIGTVLSDDPLLTARDVRCRRPKPAARVVIDPKLKIPLNSQLVTSARMAPTIIACTEMAARLAFARQQDKGRQLHQAGVGFIEQGVFRVPLDRILCDLVSQYETSTVLVEAGPSLLSSLFQQKLVNEAWVFIGPLLLGDDQARSCVTGMTVQRLTEGIQLDLVNVRKRGSDVILRYRVKYAP